MTIIKSLLDNDFYKMTMLQGYWKLGLQDTPATYKFVDRNKYCYSFDQVKQIQKGIDDLCDLRFSTAELHFLRKTGVFEEEFLNYLMTFHLSKDSVYWQQEFDQIKLYFHGNLMEASMFEIYVMAIVSEVRSQNSDMAIGEQRLQDKIANVKNKGVNFSLIDFGTRRRHSYDWQYHVAQQLKEHLEGFKGTSNMLISKELGMQPVGTMAHEWFQIHQGLYPVEQSQIKALDNWIDIYGSNLAIALTDIFSMDTFMRDFNAYHAQYFKGIRHDSGDPIEWGYKALNMFKKFDNPEQLKQRNLVFSDGLNMDKAMKIHQIFEGMINTTFGIGTHLTNDFDMKPPNIVIKNIATNNKPTVKISDEPGKTICEDLDFISMVQEKMSHWNVPEKNKKAMIA